MFFHVLTAWRLKGRYPGSGWAGLDRYDVDMPKTVGEDAKLLEAAIQGDAQAILVFVNVRQPVQRTSQANHTGACCKKA